VALTGILRERTVEDVVYRARQFCLAFRGGWHGLMDVRRRLGGLGLALERTAARQELVADYSEGIAIARGRGRLPESLFGSEVARRSEHGPRRRHACERVVGDPRDPEVGHYELAAGVEKQVGRLDVSVDDAELVRGVEGLGDLPEPGERLAWFDRPLPRPVPERPAR
jgi:hypothetical protein